MISLTRESLFWQKKNFISFILSILVFLIHSYFITEPSNGSLISLVNEKTAFFFCRSITQFAVPMFFILSGVTFFREYNNKKYLNKMKSRIFTLLIPYLLWNTLWMLFEIVSSRFFVGSQPYEVTFSNILKGVFFYECNGPFWFMFNLIVFSMASPLIFLLIKNKYVGIVSIVALSILSLFGIQLPSALFYSSNSIIFYLIGALVGYHYFELIMQKSKKWLQICSAIILVLYIGAKNLVNANLQYENSLIEIVIFTLCSFALWNVVDIFIEKIKPSNIYSRSFAIYAAHLGVSSIIWKILSLFITLNEYLLIPVFFIRVILTVLLINLLCAFAEKFLPKVYAVFMGNRLNINNNHLNKSNKTE